MIADRLLEKLNDWKPTGEGRPSGSFPLDGWTVTIAADRVDSVGCQLTKVEAVRATPLPDDAAALEAHARRAAKRATGLLEPLALIEIDRVRQIALLRSEGPKTKGGFVSYYEVELQGLNRVRLQRYKASTEGHAKREAIAFALTHEVLAKVVDDLTAE